MDLSRILVIELLVFVRREVNESEGRIVSFEVGALDVHLKAENPTATLPIVTGVQPTFPGRIATSSPSVRKRRFRKSERRDGFFEGRGLRIELCQDSASMNTKIPAFKARGGRCRHRRDFFGSHWLWPGIGQTAARG